MSRLQIYAGDRSDFSQQRCQDDAWERSAGSANRTGWNRKKDENEKNIEETIRRGKERKGRNEGKGTKILLDAFGSVSKVL